MGDVRLRLSLPGDDCGLIRIWSEVFGDDEEYIRGFLGRLYTPGRAAVAEIGGNIVSMAFFPKTGELVLPDGTSESCSYIYAVATLPDYRGRGLGAAVSRLAALKAGEDGAVVICPAEAGLFGFYERACGFENFFSVSERELPRPEKTGGPAERIDAEEYFYLRERLLNGRAHIRYSPLASEYQAALCRCGGFFKTEDGIFAAELRGKTAAVKEALGGITPETVAGTLAGEKYLIRSPGEGRPFAMLLRGKGKIAGDGSWFGFAFD